jgi:hypothetical protein
VRCLQITRLTSALEDVTRVSHAKTSMAPLVGDDVMIDGTESLPGDERVQLSKRLFGKSVPSGNAVVKQPTSTSSKQATKSPIRGRRSKSPPRKLKSQSPLSHGVPADPPPATIVGDILSDVVEMACSKGDAFMLAMRRQREFGNRVLPKPFAAIAATSKYVYSMMALLRQSGSFVRNANLPLQGVSGQ